MTNIECCGVQGCDQAIAAVLDGEPFCRGHFISHCYAQLERYDEMQKAHRLSIPDAESVRRFINQASRQADEIEHTMKDLDNLERARLLHIILWANEVGSYLRRSPRKVASIPVRLSCDKAWQRLGRRNANCITEPPRRLPALRAFRETRRTNPIGAFRHGTTGAGAGGLAALRG
jgi:hypothetical protein